MEHLESTDEARLFVDEALKLEDIANKMDPAGEQEKEDCEVEGQILHPDFHHLNPEDLDIQVEKTTKERFFKPIDLDETKVLWKKTRSLDFYQRKVVEKGIRMARSIVKSRKEKNSFQESNCTIVLGGAGSGKSTVINVLKQWLHLILKTEGDNPEHPYVMVVAPTGTAASNVRGQTLHSSFGFNFGNKHYSLSDKKRDKSRTMLKNLKFLIIDEISMIKSDLLFQLDLRLREIAQKPNKLFGGISIFFMGDIMQLRPCKGSFIFDEPTCKDYLLTYMCDTHWNTFDVILLEQNHRQGEDHLYAEMLNRIRIGDQSDADIAMLKTRVRPEGHTDLQGAMYVTCTNKSVQKMNEIRLSELKAELHVVEAKNIHPTIKNFQPKVDERGTVGGTGFVQTLRIKVGARVMLIHNLEVIDGLANGTRGELIAVQTDKNGQVIRLIIKFDEEFQGANRRRAYPSISKKYPGCTPIDKYLCSYSLAKKATVASNTAQVYQFPIVVCFAATTHKFQGGTILKPNKLAADLRTVFDDAMAYVMLSRVQDINQLYIVGSLPEDKFRVSFRCLEELEKLTNRSVNKNPNKWEDKTIDSVKVFVLNCHSLADKFLDMKIDEVLGFSDIICLSETWLQSENCQEVYDLNGYKSCFNSVQESRGKGLAIYYKEDKFKVSNMVKLHDLQATSLSSTDLDVIGVYRSSESRDAGDILSSLIDQSKPTLICGDFNVCYKEKRNHPLVRTLMSLRFEQIVNQATHIHGGWIDHVYVRKGDTYKDVNVDLYSPYYTALDHDGLLVTMEKKRENIE